MLLSDRLIKRLTDVVQEPQAWFVKNFIEQIQLFGTEQRRMIQDSKNWRFGADNSDVGRGLVCSRHLPVRVVHVPGSNEGRVSMHGYCSPSTAASIAVGNPILEVV